MHWTSNRDIFEVLATTPFAGEVNNKDTHQRWHQVPALYLKYDEASISFMAGVLATGTLTERQGKQYVDYNELSAAYLKKFGIPLEYESESNFHNLISPIWPALFTKHMPESGEKWIGIKNGYNTELYAAILWRIYVSNYIKRMGLPYLKSRRWVYSHLGTVEETEEQWLKMGLSQLDQRIGRVVRSWAKNCIINKDLTKENTDEILTH